MSAPFMTILSRHGRRRIGLGWMASTMVTMSAGAPRGLVRAASSTSTSSVQSVSNINPYLAIKELANRVQQADPVRAPRVENSDGPEYSPSQSEEKRLRSDLASEICEAYQSLPSLKLPLTESCERTQILMFLSSECSPTEDAVSKMVDHFVEKRDVQASLSTRLQAIAVSNLRKASTPAYEEILEYILKQDAMHGMQFLVALREDILRAIHWIRSSSSKEDERFPHLEDLDAYLLHLFSLWFSPGMLGE